MKSCVENDERYKRNKLRNAHVGALTQSGNKFRRSVALKKMNFDLSISLSKQSELLLDTLYTFGVVIQKVMHIALKNQHQFSFSEP